LDSKEQTKDLKVLALAGDRDNPSVTIKDEVGTIPANPMSDRQPFIIEDFYKDREARTYKKHSPTLRGDRHGLKVIVKSGLKKQIKAIRRHGERGWEIVKGKEYPTIRGAGGGHSKPMILISDVSGPTIGTSTPTKSTPQSSEKKGIIQATLGRSGPVVSPITTFSVLASLARLSVLPGKGAALKTLVERFSSRLPALRGLKDPHYYSWRTLKGSSATTKDRPTQPSWKSWGVSGIGPSGKFSTLSGSVYPRTGNVCSLSDILEEEIPDQYFLSQKLVKTLLNHAKRHKEKGHGFGVQILYPWVEAGENET